MKPIIVKEYSHFLKIETDSPEIRLVIEKYVKDELLEVLREFGPNGEVEFKPGRVFAARTQDKSEYRVHINAKDSLLGYLKRWRYDYRLESQLSDLFPGEDAVLTTPKDKQLRDYQEEIKGVVLNDQYRYTVELAMGKGKGVPKTTRIRIPNGWKLFGDLQLGDIISTPSGELTTVTEIYDNEDVDAYRITFVDGRSVVCDKYHLWEVFSYSFGKGEYRVKQTEELYQMSLEHLARPVSERNQPFIDLRIPLIHPFESKDEERDLPLEPYLLGVIIGDGHIQLNGRVSIYKDDVWLQNEVCEIVSRYGMRTSITQRNERCPSINILMSEDKTNCVIYERMIEMGLNGKVSWEKFIPQVYLEGSFDQRLRLLQGLMDTDGSVSKQQAIEFSTTSKKLAYQVQYLVRSVGDICRLTERYTHFTHKGEKKQGRKSYRLRIRSQCPSRLFRSPVKKDRCIDVNQYNRYGLKLGIKSIEPVKPIDSRCIKVAHPDALYIIDDFIVTHNTFLSLMTAAEYAKRVIILVLGRYTERWWGDLKDYAPMDQIVEIRGVTELLHVLHNEDLVKDVSIIIMTIDTVYDYIQMYNQADAEKRLSLLPPEYIWEVLGVGFRITDEVHQHFHKNFLIDLYTHIPKSVYLSATLRPDSSFLKKVYNMMFPVKERLGYGLQEKYTSVCSLHYNLLNTNKVRYKNRKKMYNHTEFEKSLMKHKSILNTYFAMVDNVVDHNFLNRRQSHHKMLIFFATKKMCGLYVEHLKKKYPKIDSRRYISEDKYENLLKAEIAVSTLGSSGTAVDIPNLATCLMTVALSSEQANLQALGRLRKLQDLDTQFFYFVCDDISKHRQYHSAKIKLFKDWVKSHVQRSLGYRL